MIEVPCERAQGAYRLELTQLIITGFRQLRHPPPLPLFDPPAYRIPDPNHWAGEKNYFNFRSQVSICSLIILRWGKIIFVSMV